MKTISNESNHAILWSSEFHRDDISPRCYQSCGAFKLLRWCGKCDFVGVCTDGHNPNNSKCEFWRTDGYSIDPLLREGNELLLFSKNS